MDVATIHPLRRLRFEFGDWSAERFAEWIGSNKVAILSFENGNTPRRAGGMKLVRCLSERLGITLDLSDAICKGTATPDEMAPVVKRIPELLTSVTPSAGDGSSIPPTGSIPALKGGAE